MMDDRLAVWCMQMRFWQVLSAGRIPITVDTDLALPLDDEIDWHSCVVIEPTASLVAKRVLAIWANGRDVERRQEACGAIYSRYFSSSVRYVDALLASLERERARVEVAANTTATSSSDTLPPTSTRSRTPTLKACPVPHGPTAVLVSNGQLEHYNVSEPPEHPTPSPTERLKGRQHSDLRQHQQHINFKSGLASKGPPTQQCTCFSLCSMGEVDAFLDAIPASVHSQHSPWYGYLSAVYRQEELPLPFSLASLRFFYSNDPSYWPQEIEWPMAPCSPGKGVQHAARHSTTWVLRGNASSTRTFSAPSSSAVSNVHSRARCSDSECERWTWRAAQNGHSSTSALRTLGRQHLRGSIWFANRAGRSRGSLLLLHTEPPSTSDGREPIHVWPLPRAAEAPTALHRRFWPSGSMLEVIRVSQPRAYEEGVNSYGIWYYAAPGSGMWLCTGERTLVLPRATDRPKLRTIWLKQVSAANRAAAAYDIGVISARRKARDCFPLMAAALGYTTVQNLEGNHPLQGATEVISLEPHSMHGDSPVRACPPQGMLSTGLPEQAGGSGVQSCECDDGEPTSNCLHVASQRHHGAHSDLRKIHSEGLPSKAASSPSSSTIGPVLVSDARTWTYPWTPIRENPCAGLV